MRTYALAALLVCLSGPAFAQGSTSGSGLSGGTQSTLPVPDSGAASPSQLDFGTAGASGAAAASAIVPGQVGSGAGVDRGLPGAGAASGPSGGAGISTGFTPAEDYTQPIYGHGSR